MLQTHSHSQSFSFDRDTLTEQMAVHITGRMAGGQNDRSLENPSGVGFDTFHLAFVHNQAVHAGFKMHLTSALQDGVAHILNDAGQLVCSDMRMGIRQNGCTGSMLTEHIQNLVHTAAFLASGVEFAVGIGTGSSFSETVIALGIYLMLARDAGQIQFPVAHILSTLHHDWAIAQLYQTQGRKKSSGTGTHHNHTATTFHILIFRRHISLIRRLLVDVNPHLQVNVDGALTGINAFLQNAHPLDGAFIESFLAGHKAAHGLLVIGLLGQSPQLKFMYHYFSCFFLFYYIIRYRAELLIRTAHAGLLPPCAPAPALSSFSYSRIPEGWNAAQSSG